eukprot:5144877-Pyramimonas_sp.AAC.1
MARMGWNMYGGPAVLTDKGRVSGGVCVLCRAFLDTWAPDERALSPSRAARCYFRSEELGM